MTDVTATIEDPTEARRALVQKAAAGSLRRRTWWSRVFMGAIGLALVIAIIPLASLLWNVISKGIKVVSWSFLTQSQAFPSISDPNAIGGIRNAIVGSILVDGMAIVIAIPLALILSVALFEFNNRFMKTLRMCLEVMIGLPSILLGIFIYAVVVVPLSHGIGTAYAGALAIALLMTPLIAIAGEAALRDVPQTLQEAGLALGARRSSVMRRVVLPFARPRLLTGILLALSRAVGETAPILFIIGVSLVPSWSPTGQATALPVLIFDYLGSQYPALRDATWGIALVLMAAVLVLNLTSRIIVARTQNKGRK